MMNEQFCRCGCYNYTESLHSARGAFLHPKYSEYLDAPNPWYAVRRRASEASSTQFLRGKKNKIK
jgi:hypothetical protein